MAFPKNYAALLHSKGARLVVEEAPFPEPKEGHVIIKTAALALNPVDHVMQDTEFYNLNSSRFESGDRIISHANAIASQDPREGAFQTYVRVPEQLVSKIPDTLEFRDAKDYLILPLPAVGDAKPTGKTVLVWGGSSSIGSTATQLAVASGVRVFTTASPHNNDYCKHLGAAEVFDHTQTDVVEQITQALKDVNKDDFLGVYDAIDDPASQKPVLELLRRLGGGIIVRVREADPSNFPEGVVSKLVMAPFQVRTAIDVIRAVWEEFLPRALDQGLLKPAPRAMVAGLRLESIQAGLELLKKGVSAKKVVVEI